MFMSRAWGVLLFLGSGRVLYLGFPSFDWNCFERRSQIPALDETKKAPRVSYSSNEPPPLPLQSLPDNHTPPRRHADWQPDVLGRPHSPNLYTVPNLGDSTILPRL